MGEKVKYPFRGWRTTVLEVPRYPNAATIIELRSGFLGYVRTTGIVDTAERYQRGNIIGFFHSGTARYVVDPEYTHVEVEASVRSGSSPARWRARFLPSGELKELTGPVSGEQADVVVYRGDPMTATLELHEKNKSCWVNQRGFDGRWTAQLLETAAPFRGSIEIPGPGLLEIESRGPWSLTPRSPS
ncbi:hypothetical protein [Actinocorallia sp. A-T 12471]|uniref:hypothetical protein n=1 Tax=Actinocorallia sp. A-T 12471 TaxID=3089813 RepID=UPI0029CAE91D|nr:hypothetical protein [Actinocorallia sp. A-T 12471]MDX6744373.1 hypothetical protein [Actinocorallia sp. A-T 12471]